MLARYNPIDIERALRTTPATPPFPPITDRAAWEAVRQRLGEAEVATILAQAEQDAQTPVPFLPATLFLDFARTGRRELYEDPQSQRGRMLWNLTLAECLENAGRFLDPLLDLAWATCEESSWVYPAHESTLADIQHPYLDLGVAMKALMLAEFDLLVGSKLVPQLGKRIRDEIDRRCFTPYLTRHDHWWLYQSQERSVNNWTAVCNSGIVGAAIYLETDPARLAAMIAQAARSLDDYLATFDPDGGSSEGPGYWGYGFGHYVMLAHLVAERTGGQVDFLAGERLRQIAAYPLRTLLSRGTYVNFSDCQPDVALEPSLLHYLGNRLDLPDLHALAAAQPTTSPHRAYADWGLRSLFWLPPASIPPTYVPARHDWFSGLMWMLARIDPADSNALVVAAKGGHNDEMHNQNDVGTLIVHWQGESLIADLGAGHYTKDYFGEARYTYFVNSSLGHAVPVPNGQVQQEGRTHAAHLIEHRVNEQESSLCLELKDAYPPEADLVSLRRCVTLHRTPLHGWVEVVDEFQFRHGPAPFESALLTFHPVEFDAGSVWIVGRQGRLQIQFDATRVAVRLEAYTDVEFDQGIIPINRIVFAQTAPVQQGAIRLVILPTRNQVDE